MSLALTNLPSLVTGFHSISSFFLSGLLALLSPLANPLFSPSTGGLGTTGTCYAIILRINIIMALNKKILIF
jgi:hypothetical protein